jgi:general stress protein YciG
MARKMTGGRTSKRPASKLKGPRQPGDMSVREAGRLGGLTGGRKGGLAVKAERGIEFYQEIGRLGGQRVRELIAAGRKAIDRSTRRGARR